VHAVMDATYPGTVLDVGCWKGDFARMLRDLSYHVTGTDLAHMPEADDNMNLFCHGWAHEALRRWPAESFGVVTCLETLEHIPTRHLRLTCREMVRVAQRGVLVEVPGWDDGAVMHLRVFTLDALKDLFEDCSAEVLVAPNSAEYTTVWFRRKM
jgi:ubiquinone/menaquinone biosynthesis C-methylase UbiE